MHGSLVTMTAMATVDPPPDERFSRFETVDDEELEDASMRGAICVEDGKESAERVEV